MAGFQENIPLFPLDTVLFPSSRIGLHIFEPRYRAMIQRCIENSQVFGINLFAKDHIHPVGCTARVCNISQVHPDGSFDVIIEGVHKYRLIKYHTNQAGYLEGSVELIHETLDTPPENLINKAIKLFNTMIDIINPGEREPVSLREDDKFTRLSYKIAEKAGLDLDDRQRLLEIPSEKKRLAELINHMEQLIPILAEYETLKRIIANDGYLPREKK